MGFPVEYPGGITNYVRSLASAQALKGDDVTIYCNGDNDSGDKLTQYNIKRYNSSIRPFSLDIDAQDATYIDFYDKLCSEYADIYHIHSLLGVDVRFAKKISESNLNYLVSLHDYNFICPRVFMVDKEENVCRQVNVDKCEKCIGKIEQFDIILRLFNKLKIRVPTLVSEKIYKRIYIMEAFLKKASFILPVSNRVGEIFSEFSIVNQKTITIGNNTAFTLPNRDKNIRGKINIAFLGSFTKIKGAELFIELCKKNTNELLSFCFYGRGNMRLLAEFEKVGGVNYGPYNSLELLNILQDIHVGAVLSIWEDNGPQVVMEMLNNAIPVLGTNRGGIPDFITHENGFLFEPDEKSGIELASKWLNELTIDSVLNYHKNIKQLKTPLEHYLEISNVYISSIDEKAKLLN